MSPDRFWSLSLREWFNERRAAERRAELAAQRELRLAWQIQRVRIKAMRPDGGWHLPPFEDLVNEGKPQTPEQQAAMIQALSAQLGVGLRKLEKGPNGTYRLAAN